MSCTPEELVNKFNELSDMIKAGNMKAIDFMAIEIYPPVVDLMRRMESIERRMASMERVVVDHLGLDHEVQP